MLAVDTNVLVYAHRREAKEHQVAFNLLEALAGGSERWSIPWPCIFEFYCIATHPRIWKGAESTSAQAWQQIQAWLAAPALRLLTEPDGFAQVLESLIRPRVRGPLVHDARIAALCLAHGVEALLSRDRDFSLFPELQIRNPFEQRS